MIPIRELEELPHSDDLYIFGAGHAGQTLLRLLRQRPDLTAVGFIDNGKTGTLDGLPIFGFEAFLCRKNERTQVVIASMYMFDIALQLRRSGIVDFYSAHPLIQKILEKKRKRIFQIKMATLALGFSGGISLLLLL